MNHRYTGSTGSAHWDGVFMPPWRAPLVSPVLLLLLSGISLSVKRWTAWRSSWRPGFSQSEHRTTQWVRVCWTWRPGSVPSGIWLLWNWKNFISWCLWTKRTELESDSRAERWMMRCSGEIWSSQTWAAAATLRWPTSVYRVCVSGCRTSLCRRLSWRRSCCSLTASSVSSWRREWTTFWERPRWPPGAALSSRCRDFQLE